MNGGIVTSEIAPQRSRICRKILLVAALALTVSTGIALALDLPELIPLVLFPVLAWWSWSVFRASGLGLILLVVTLELVTLDDSATFRGGFFAGVVCLTLLFVPFVACMLASIVVFLLKACEPGSPRRANGWAAAAACLLPVLWFVVSSQGARFLADRSRAGAIARCGVPAVIAKLQAATEQFGRAPQDEQEAVQWLGTPLPLVPERGQIRYVAAGGKHFFLALGYDTLSDFAFDSDKPEQGWHWAQVPRAPDDRSPQDGTGPPRREKVSGTVVPAGNGS